jgi:hypothetical protein
MPVTFDENTRTFRLDTANSSYSPGETLAPPETVLLYSASGLDGLNPGYTYRVEELGLTLPGQTLLNLGLPLPLPHGDFGSFTWMFKRVEA